MPKVESKSDYRKRNATGLGRLKETAKSAIGILDMPQPGRKFGIDMSGQWEGTPDWAVARLRGCSFAAIKITNGIQEVQNWRENWATAKAAGLPRIGYGWVYPKAVWSPAGQARKLAGLLAFDPPEIGYEADFEWTWGGNPTLEDLISYLEALELATGRKPIVYTGGFWGEAEQGDTDITKTDRLWADYLLHLAHYGASSPRDLAPWGQPDIWQWTANGNGVAFGFNPLDDRKIDLNYWMRSDAEFDALLRGTRPVPAPGPGPEPEPQPEPSPPNDYEWLPLFGGAARLHHAHFEGAAYHMIELDLSRFDIDFAFGTSSTPRALSSRGFDIAINGLDGWYADRKLGRQLAGRVISRGRQYTGRDEEQVLYISKSNRITLGPQAPAWNACAFPNLLVKDGQVQKINKSVLDVRARTAFGVNAEQTTAYVCVVDGDDIERGGAGLSVQATATLMARFCALAVLGDSGGSTTMAIRGEGGAQIVGNPIDRSGSEITVQGRTYRLRSVLVNMGFTLKGD